jgi:hypothetical protein
MITGFCVFYNSKNIYIEVYSYITCHIYCQSWNLMCIREQEHLCRKCHFLKRFQEYLHNDFMKFTCVIV